MGKLIRNGIEYGGGNGTDIFEVTQAEYDTLVQAGTLVHNALYVITDAPNLNATAQDISYDGGATTVKEMVDRVSFQTAKNVKFQIASGRLLIYLYTDDAQANGLRIDFDSSANVIELSSITNGTTTPTNRITFTHI